MWKDNMLIANHEERVLHIGDDALVYLDQWNRTPFAYPEGKVEVGDVLVYFAWEAKACRKEIETLVKEGLCPASETEAESFLLVSCMEKNVVKPLVKEIPQMKENVILDTIYETNEIVVKKEKGQISFHMNGQKVAWDADRVKSAAAIIKDRSVRFFHGRETEQDDLFQKTLEEKRIAPWCDRSNVIGKHVKDILQKKVYEKMISEEAEHGECFFACGGKAVALRTETIQIGSSDLRVYIFSDADSLMAEISEKSKAYKKITTDSIPGTVSQPQFNAFRLWGNEEKIKEVGHLLQKSSITNTTILLTGESGTGKTFLAREIHKNSRKSHGPFVHVNCAAIPYQLMESELFGYEEGAFTGAKKGGKKGYFEMAYGGTLFLDEIGEIPVTLQGKLLEVLQSRTFYRVGGTEKLASDVRLIAATNKNLKEMVREKRFREDLYYRINVFPVEIPPLRERIASLYSIVMDILPDICSRLEIEPLMLSSQAYDKMLQYPWPGNIRELENVLEKAAILCDGKIIQPEDVLLSEGEVFTTAAVTLQEVRENAEREAIVSALQMFHGDKNKAAAYLDIGRSNMFEKVKKYRIQLKEMEADDFR